MKKLLLLVLAFTLILSCSKDDNPETNTPVDTNGGEIFTSQVVTVNLPGIALSQNEYQGTLGTVPVKLIKSGQSSLLFSVPQGQNGFGDLVIPALNVTVHYKMTPTVLEGTPDEVMADFNSNMNTFKATLDNSPEANALQNSINSFNTYYEGADATTKAQVAEVYQANKLIFDQVFLGDTAGRVIVAGTEIYISKHVTAVALIGVGVAAAVGSPALAAVVVGVAAYKAYQANKDAAEHVYSTIGATIGGWFGDNDRGVNVSGPTLLNDEMEQITFTLRERKITAADEAKSDPLAVQYFTSVEQYNFYANEGNEVINEVNTEEGTNFSDIPAEQLPATAQEFETGVTQEILQNIQFSINDPNLLLVSASIAEEGILNIRVKILGTPSSLPVESELRYTYNDNFSSFSGTLPINVTNLICETITDYDGNEYNVVPIGEQCWTARNLNVSHYRNGDPIPQIQDDQAWLNATEGAWCYYANNTANGVVYGKLYNWYAVNDPRGLAPEGYHVPSQDEWMQMKDFLGGYMVAGGPLKSTEHWNAPNVGATNETGFSAVPGSQRNGAFYADGWGVVGVYWSSTSNPDDEDNEEAWSNTMTATSAGCSHYQGSWKKVGMSVRCVKD